MSSTTKQRIDDERRSILMDRLLGSPGQSAAYWSSFFTEFWDNTFTRWVLPNQDDDRYTPSNLVGSLLMRGVDITEEGDHLVVAVEMPNFPKENITVRLHDNILRVSAYRESVFDKEQVSRVYVSSQPSRFNKSIWIPALLEEGAKVKAKYEGGVLRVTIPLKSSEKITVE
jgi:HSP20 family molecular chaperone IbpA